MGKGMQRDGKGREEEERREGRERELREGMEEGRGKVKEGMKGAGQDMGGAGKGKGKEEGEGEGLQPPQTSIPGAATGNGHV